MLSHFVLFICLFAFFCCFFVCLFFCFCFFFSFFLSWHPSNFISAEVLPATQFLKLFAMNMLRIMKFLNYTQLPPICEQVLNNVVLFAFVFFLKCSLYLSSFCCPNFEVILHWESKARLKMVLVDYMSKTWITLYIYIYIYIYKKVGYRESIFREDIYNISYTYVRMCSYTLYAYTYFFS